MKEFNFVERHMGTDVSLSLVVTNNDGSLAQTVAADTFAKIAEYERKFSRFLPESELSRLNVEGVAIVSDEFIKVLKRAIELSEATGGAFNPLVQVFRLGYQKSFAEMTGVAKVSPSKINTDLFALKINGNTVTLAEGQQLDFGGFLKGYLASQLAAEIKKMKEISGVIVNIGGDLATFGFDEKGQPFSFGIYNPVRDEEIEVVVLNKALATSGTYKRVWETELGLKHHIVDTTTGDNPESDIISASIIAEDGGVAEAMTKVLFRGGSAAAEQNLPSNTQYLLINKSGEIITNIP